VPRALPLTAGDSLLGLKAPQVDKPVIEPLTDDQFRAVVKACRRRDLPRQARRGHPPADVHYRGPGEVVALQTGDLSLRTDSPTATIRCGKGGTGRVVPLAVETAAAIDRYLRARKGHRLAGEGALWIGDRGKGFTYDALHKTLAMRANGARRQLSRAHPTLAPVVQQVPDRFPRLGAGGRHPASAAGVTLSTATTPSAGAPPASTAAGDARAVN
jgi:integrase